VIADGLTMVHVPLLRDRRAKTARQKKTGSFGPGQHIVQRLLMLVVPTPWARGGSLTGLEWFGFVGVEAAFFAATDAAMGQRPSRMSSAAAQAACVIFCVGDAEAVDVGEQVFDVGYCW